MCNHNVKCDICTEVFFYRDSHGNEVDLIVKSGRTLHPIEVKSGATFDPEFITGIERFRDAVGTARCGAAAVWYNGRTQSTFKGVQVRNPMLHGGFRV